MRKTKKEPLTIQIEKLRRLMMETALEKGIDSKECVRLSQQLDDLLNQIQTD